MNPTPVFTKPTPPHTQTVGAVTIAMTADMAHAAKYTLTVTRNGTAVAAPATVQSGNAQISTTEIDIPTTGTGDLVIAAAYFNGLGAGSYTLKIKANGLGGQPGAGEAIVTFMLTAAGGE